jgi:hypothetical protein
MVDYPELLEQSRNELHMYKYCMDKTVEQFKKHNRNRNTTSLSNR